MTVHDIRYFLRSSYLIQKMGRKLVSWFMFLTVMILSILSSSLKPNEFAIVQFDSRSLSDYWEASANWNNKYCTSHGHKFIYYTETKECKFKGEKLSSAWCKVKAMIQANDEFPDVKVFLYLDSDAVVSKHFADKPLTILFEEIKSHLDWNPSIRPIIFNQDGPCWWCNLVAKVGYTMCLNSGTVLWWRDPYSEKILGDWWHMSLDSYESNPLKRY